MRRSLPPLNALVAFEAAARLLSFKRAAAELHVTHGAIGHQVRALERALGLKLFERAPRALRLTREGARYASAARDALDALHAATRALAPRRRGATLRVSTLPSFATSWLVPRLGAFRKKHPRIDLALHSSAELVDLVRGPFDIAIRHGSGDYPGLHVELLMRDEIVPVASPRLDLARPEQLRKHTLLHDDAKQGWREWLAAAGVRGVDAARGLVFHDSGQLVQAAVAGHGVALARRSLAEADLRAGRLVQPFARSQPTPFATYVVCLPSRAEEPAIRAFRHFVLRQADGLRRTRAPKSGRAG
jgi:LysR family glycine cleavage system transcriptional activator